MMDRILVPTDGSEGAEQAENYALDLAELTGAEVHALYVIETRATYILTIDLDSDEMEAYEEFGEKTVTKVANRAAERGLSGVGATRKGKIAPEIVDYAKEKNIDHIVMGRRGQGAIGKYVGSTAEKVIRMSDRPVTVVEE